MKNVVFRWGGRLVIAAVLLLFVAFRVPHSVSALKDKHEQIRQLQKENADMANEVREKRDRIRRLRESQSEIELEIRKSLKLQRQNDTSIVVPKGQ